MVQLTPPGWSPDANWFWDGREWQDAVSPDGKWRYNGKDWKRFRGKRTAMPIAPLYVATAYCWQPGSRPKAFVAERAFRPEVLTLGVTLTARHRSTKGSRCREQSSEYFF